MFDCSVRENPVTIAGMLEAFVILEHSGCGRVHYDLMLADGRVLATWRCEDNPTEMLPGQTISTQKIQDHRIEYLSIEGPIGRVRGVVKQTDTGRYERIHSDESRVEFQLNGGKLRGRFELRREDAASEKWALRRLG